MSRAEELADRIDGLMETGGWRKDAVFIAVSAAALAVSLLYGDVGGFDTAWIAVMLCGISISVDAISGLLLRHDIRADVIVFIALCAALYIGDVFTAGEVAAIMQIGGLLEGVTAERARSGIGKLIDMSPATARLVDEEGESVINASDVKEGDILRVLPGETVPADGILISGSTSIDQSFMTGESLPADKTAGDEVYGGTVNQYGAFDMRAIRDGEDSSIQRMIRLVDSADAGKATTVRAADRWATWIVALIAVIAVSVYLLTEDIVRTVAVLVVFCPCAFILATPTAVVAAIGNASKHGFLVRDGGSLERLSKADRAVFDKTGTLTYGRFEVASVEPADGIDKMYLYSVAASAESMSEHPLGKAVVRDYQSLGGRPKSPEGFSAVP
ncbi:MAG: cation-translocating P-type ATPase, partial [Candidatus Methanomethylophilaceae archaeon]|nr:cation-translocating P-type ATPase [Candidatus Methanomethylophilaceae archaeon]